MKSGIFDNVHPDKLFLIDSLGALLSAIMLGYVLVRFKPLFGMPEEALHALSLIASIFFVFSFVCFLSKPAHWKRYLKFVAIANLSYCFLTICLIFFLYQQLTILGLIYFVGEIMVVTTLALFELKAASVRGFLRE